MQWLNGRPLDGDIAPFDLRDRGLLLGDGVFDTLMVASGRPVFAPAHLSRLEASCRALAIPFDRCALEATMMDAARQTGTGALRSTLTRGPAPRGLALPKDPAPTVLTQATPGPLSAAWQPLRLITTDIRRNETSPMAGHKGLSYLDAIWALRQAQAAHADEALFLNTMGRVACCATGNLFMIKDNHLITPPLSDGMLAGIIRAQLLSLGQGLFDGVSERPVAPCDLHSAQALFMTNSLRLIAPITALDGTAVPLCAPGLVDLARALYDRIDSDDLAKGYTQWPMTD